MNRSNPVLDFLFELGAYHRDRVNKYKTYWDFYEGRHWSYDDARSVTFNYTRKIVDIKSNFLVKNGFEITIPDNPLTMASEPESRSFIKAVLDDQWRRNDKEQFMIEATQMGGVTGDLFIRLSIDTHDEDGEKYIKTSILPSQYVFPIYGGDTGTDRTKMLECHIIYPVVEYSTRKKGFFKKENIDQKAVMWHREIWTKDLVELYQGENLKSTEPNLFEEIPIVHIKNYPNTNDDFGISDLEDIIPIQKLLNEKATDISDVIDYHGSPVTILKGARIDNVERGADKVWSLPVDADASNLELSGDLKANLQFLDKIYKSLLDISSVPEQVLNPSKSISNTPGVALHMTYLPLIENRRIKTITYAKGLKKINRLMLKILRFINPTFKTKFDELGSGRFRTDISFGQPLPRDESLELQNKQTRLNMGITDRVAELVRDGIGEQDAIRMIDKADADHIKRLEKIAEIESSYNVKSKPRSVFGNPKTPDPVVQGDKVSINSLKN